MRLVAVEFVIIIRQNVTMVLPLKNVQLVFRQVFTLFLIAVRSSTVTTASRKETMITSSNYLPLSC